MMNLAEGLATAGAALTQLMVETPGHPFPAQVPDNYPFVHHRVFLDTNIRVSGAALNLLQSGSYHLERFKKVALMKALEQILAKENFDIIQAEGPFVLGFLAELRSMTKARIILRAHNVEYLIWERVAKSGRHGLLSPYLKLQSARLKREEIAIASQVDGLVVMSDTDLQAFKKLGVQTPATVIGIGTSLKAPEILPEQTEGRKIFHLGAMNWYPNKEGVEWFIEKVFPRVKAEVPGIKLHLAGHGMPAGIVPAEHQEAIQLDSAPDAATYMLSHGIMIVPLLSGSGIRVKIIEGLRLGKVILTTKIGAEGLGVVDGRELLIASDEVEFAEKLIQCFADPALCGEISENARKFAAAHFDTAQLARQLLSFYKSLSIV